jgi:replicative DNA helicase
VLETVNAAGKARLFTLDEPDLSLFDLCTHARQVAVREHGLDLVLVDYLQLMRVDPPSHNRTEDVSSFSRGLKRLARELDVPVIAVAQLSRQVEQRTDKRPLLSDLRESGQIEADADAVIMLYRDDYYHDSDDPAKPNCWSAKTATAPPETAPSNCDLHPGRVRRLDVQSLGSSTPAWRLGPAQRDRLSRRPAPVRRQPVRIANCHPV